MRQNRSFFRGASFFITLLVLLVGCGDQPTTPPTPGPVPGPGPAPDTRISIATVGPITPGEEVRLYGRNLDQLESLLVDRTPVVLTVISTEEAKFLAPSPVACDVDGRAVSLFANDTISVWGKLRVKSPITMELAESRVLNPDSMAGCIQLPAGQEFVFTALNPTFDTTNVPLATLSVSVSRPGTSAMQSMKRMREPFRHEALNTRAHVEAEGRALQGYQTASNAVQFDADPIPFDPRYATAALGDTLEFIDWLAAYKLGDPCRLPRERLPTYSAVVVGMDDTKRIVWVIDLKAKNAQDWQKPSVRDDLRYISNLTEPWLNAAARQVFDPDYQQIKGGGGRVYVVASDLFYTQMATDYGTSNLQASCPNASEMVTIGWPAGVMTAKNQMYTGVLAHEYGHNAERITSQKYGLYSGSGVLVEAWANVFAADVATRMASKQNLNATLDMSSNTWPSHLLFEQIGAAYWGGVAEHSLWARGWSSYTFGATLLMYLRQLKGEDDLAVPVAGPTLLQRIGRVQQNWRPEAELEVFASEAGMTGLQLLDELTLALATDDLVPAAAAAKQGLPQIRAWDMSNYYGWIGRGRSPRRPSRPHEIALNNTVDYSRDSRYTLSAAGASYDALYFLAPSGQGATVELGKTGTAGGRLRITRIR